MFGFVMANLPELTKAQKSRYTAVYCGICRRIREGASPAARLALSYDMAFLGLLLMSLYEPDETQGSKACGLHPIRPRPWTDCDIIRYCADMNVALAYYKCLDDYEDEKKTAAKLAADKLGSALPRIREAFPRQCQAIETCLRDLSQLERTGCQNPDEPANCFGALMAELLVWQEDLWAPMLREMGMALGRFIYLADAAVDYKKDLRKGRYNPFAAMGTGAEPARWEQYLVLAMGRCTDYYERLPLVQDKPLLDNILYSGIWVQYRTKQGKKGAAREETDV